MTIRCKLVPRLAVDLQFLEVCLKTVFPAETGAMRRTGLREPTEESLLRQTVIGQVSKLASPLKTFATNHVRHQPNISPMPTRLQIGELILLLYPLEG